MATGIQNKTVASVGASKGSGGNVRLSYDGKKSIEEILVGDQANISSVWRSFDSPMTGRLIWSENLTALRTLANDPKVKGKVRLVYIDPPFATNSEFQSLDQTSAYSDYLQGADFVEFLRERLILIRELMANDGSIYVHLDEKMIFEIKLVMDEVFGSTNYQNLITRKKCSTKNTTRKKYGNISDYILFYSKSKKFVWNRPYDPWPEEKIEKEYPCIDSSGRRFKKVPIHAPGVRNGETGQPWRGKLPPAGKHWQVPPSKLDELDANGDIYWSATGNPRKKVYFDSSKGIPRQDIWLEYRDSINQNMKGTGYPTEKNLEMLMEIIKASSNPGDLVLDAFCGSGTTLHAAQELRRLWIGIDQSPEAISCSLKRFTTGVEAMGDYVESNKATMTRGHQNLSCVIPSASFELQVSDEFREESQALFGL